MKFKVEFKENNHTIKTNFGQIYKVESSNEGYEEGYEEGYDVGYNKGHLIGKQEGYDDGHKAGLEEGYSKGHSDGVTEGYNQGYNSGKSEGHDEGYSEGLVAGKTEGYNEGYQIGYSEGYTKGKTDGYNDGYSKGYDAGVSHNWDVIQNYGKRIFYPYAFAYDSISDTKILEAKHPILGTGLPTTSGGSYGTNGGNSMFRLNRVIEEIRTPIVITSGSQYVFDTCAKLKKIMKVTVNASQVFTNWFRDDVSLEEIEFGDFGEEGDPNYIKCEIGQAIDFSSCSNLNVKSAKSVITHLVNGGFKVKFHDNVWERLEADEEKAPDGGTWKNYVESVIGCTT